MHRPLSRHRGLTPCCMWHKMHVSHNYLKNNIRKHSSIESLMPSLCSPCSSAPCLFSLPAMTQLGRQTLCLEPPHWGQALNIFPLQLSNFPPPACCLTHKPDVCLELCYPSDSTTEVADCCTSQKCNYRQVIYTSSLVLRCWTTTDKWQCTTAALPTGLALASSLTSLWEELLDKQGGSQQPQPWPSHRTQLWCAVFWLQISLGSSKICTMKSKWS